MLMRITTSDGDVAFVYCLYELGNLLTCYTCLLNQGSTLAMCPLARMHFLGRRASSGHNNSFYAGPRGQWLSDRWQTHVPVFFC